MQITQSTNQHGDPILIKTFDNGTVVEEFLPAPPMAVPEPTERNISGVAYLRRFTQAQRIAIRTLAETDPIARDLMHLLDSTIAQGGMVNLLDPDTIAGVGYLAAVMPSQNIDPAVILA